MVKIFTDNFFMSGRYREDFKLSSQTEFIESRYNFLPGDVALVQIKWLTLMRKSSVLKYNICLYVCIWLQIR